MPNDSPTLNLSSAPARVFDPRWPALSVAAIGAGQLILTAARLPAWPCPMHSLTGIPCPGCGLTRATVAFCSGQLETGLHLHAFGALVPLLLLLLLALAFTPKRIRVALAAALLQIENRSRTFTVLGILFIAYWVVRLCGVLPQPG